MDKDREKIGGKKMAVSLQKRILTQEKKEIFKKIIGKFSSKIDLNKIRLEWKNEKN